MKTQNQTSERVTLVTLPEKAKSNKGVWWIFFIVAITCFLTGCVTSQKNKTEEFLKTESQRLIDSTATAVKKKQEMVDSLNKVMQLSRKDSSTGSSVNSSFHNGFKINFLDEDPDTTSDADENTQRAQDYFGRIPDGNAPGEKSTLPTDQPKPEKKKNAGIHNFTFNGNTISSNKPMSSIDISIDGKLTRQDFSNLITFDSNEALSQYKRKLEESDSANGKKVVASSETVDSSKKSKVKISTGASVLIWISLGGLVILLIWFFGFRKKKSKIPQELDFEYKVPRPKID
jgi:LPXTG-motif cell wall-anchored protein